MDYMEDRLDYFTYFKLVQWRDIHVSLSNQPEEKWLKSNKSKVTNVNGGEVLSTYFGKFYHQWKYDFMSLDDSDDVSLRISTRLILIVSDPDEGHV